MIIIKEMQKERNKYFAKSHTAEVAPPGTKPK